MALLKQIVAALWRYFTTRKKSWKFARACLYMAAGLLSGPLWLPFLTAFVEANSGISIEEPSPLLAIPVLALGALAVIIPELMESKFKYDFSSKEAIERRKQDSDYAEKIRDLLPEARFDSIVQSLGADHSIQILQSRALSDLAFEFEKADTGFIDEEMSALENQYMEALEQLQQFYATNFFYLNNGLMNDRTYLFPEGNWDRGCPTPEQERLYGRLRLELNNHLDNLSDVRTKFLKTARMKLLLSSTDCIS